MNRRKIILIAVALLVLIGIAISLYMYQRRGSVTDVSSTAPNPSAQVSDATRKSIQDQLRTTTPTAFLSNILPADRETFSMNFYVDKERQSFVFVVLPKTFSLQQVQEDVQAWLLEIGLTEAQIDSLIIEYDAEVN